MYDKKHTIMLAAELNILHVRRIRMLVLGISTVRICMGKPFKMHS